MKSLTSSDVLSVATELISKNGSTTTLEVKLELRNRGFYATQKEVSSTMDGLDLLGKLSFTNNGVWRTYFMQNSAVASTVSSIYGNIKRIVKAKGSNKNIKVDAFSYTKRDGTVIASVHHSDQTAHYAVSSTTSSEQLYFPKKYTKDEIRQAYAKINGVHFHDTRVAKLF